MCVIHLYSTIFTVWSYNTASTVPMYDGCHMLNNTYGQGTVWYCTVLYCIVWYSTVVYNIKYGTVG